MCRLYGFRSVIQSQVHSSLVASEQSFMQLSQDHPDGWGVAYYIGGAPHVIKSESAAVEDALFQRVSGIVASQTVIAHLRKATLGERSITNTHPFQYGPWVFAHNGNISNFSVYRSRLLQMIPPELSRYVIGETDSELIFYTILGMLCKHGSLFAAITLDQLLAACRQAVRTICDLVGEFSREDAGPERTYLSFLISNGSLLVAHHGGKHLLYSTYKSRCPDRTHCRSFHRVCEAPPHSSEAVNHLIFSSEPIVGENIWQALQPGDLLGVDQSMQLRWYQSL